MRATILCLISFAVLLTGCGAATEEGSTGSSSSSMSSSSSTSSTSSSSSSAPTVTVNAIATAGGTITPLTSIAKMGAIVKFDFKSEFGFVLDKISGCEGFLSASSYTTKALSADCTLNVAFKEFKGPSNLSSLPFGPSLYLQWTPLAGSNSYNIYYATVPNINPLNIDELQGGKKLTNQPFPAIIEGLTPGIVYYFVVTAVFRGSETAASNEITGVIAPANAPVTSVMSQKSNASASMQCIMVDDKLWAARAITKSTYRSAPAVLVELNHNEHCGQKNWRLPQFNELMSSALTQKEIGNNQFWTMTRSDDLTSVNIFSFGEPTTLLSWTEGEDVFSVLAVADAN